MTVKNIALLKRKPGMSLEDFKDYYENRHAPMMLGILPGVVEYRRNYVEIEGMFVGAAAAAPDFDVVTELVFTDADAAAAALAIAMEPETAARIATDEENFLDRPRTRMFVVGPRDSEL